MEEFSIFTDSLQCLLIAELSSGRGREQTRTQVSTQPVRSVERHCEGHRMTSAAL